MPDSAYQKLRIRMREAALLRSSAHVLSWDQETHLPANGVSWRATQLGVLSRHVHELVTSPEIGDWLAQAEAESLPVDPTMYAKGEDHFTPDDAATMATNLRGWRRAYDRATKLPVELVEEWSRMTSIAQTIWAEARRKSDFSHFQNLLGHLVQLARRRADAWGWQDCRYDALLEEYEPGARSTEIAALFGELGPQLSTLLAPAAENAARLPRDVLASHYPIPAQQAFNREVAEAVGFDFSSGRLDTTTHPFCTGLGPGDTRLTTRYDEADFTSSLYGVLHEVGHGLYDQGLDPIEWGHPAGDACSLGIHESQSRLWENHVGGSRAFWRHWFPRAVQHFPHLGKLDPDAVAAAVARVEPSFIRVEADEVTYDLHIIVRFEIERALIAGDLAVADVPGAWNERFRTLLGLEVPDDARGCLQDVHWSCGLFGYFATYTLGNLNAAQLMHHARRTVPGLDDALAAGKYAPLLVWLRQKIHWQGQRFDAPDLMRQATGEPTQTRYFLDHLRGKFL
ncbi:MAG: carboxypeptidase M32 [Verrucomicrobiales bacterium]